MIKKFFYLVLSFSPLPVLVRLLVNCRRPQFLIQLVIKKLFIENLKVDISEAEFPAEKYQTVLEFFTRRLYPGARPQPSGFRQVLSPVDGRVMNYGKIIDGTMVQIKSNLYSFAELVGSDFAEFFKEGDYITLYLSPRDYHRIHHPVYGYVDKVVAYPGRLLPVNRFSLDNFQEVFSRNRRVVVSYNSTKNKSKNFQKKKTSTFYNKVASIIPCLSCWVGALNVGEIKILFDENFYRDASQETRDNRNRLVKTYSPLTVSRGKEAGCFELGSTVILIFPSYTIRWLPSLSVNRFFHVGEPIAHIRPKAV